MSSPKMKVLQKDAPPLTNSIQKLRGGSEGDGESSTTKPSIALAKKNCSIRMLRFVKGTLHRLVRIKLLAQAGERIDSQMNHTETGLYFSPEVSR